jgi:hypothetical protein
MSVCASSLVLLSGGPQEAKYVEGRPNTTSAWAGWSRFDNPVNRYGGVHSLLICTSSQLGFLTCHRASQQDNTYWTKYQKADRASPLVTLWVDPPPPPWRYSPTVRQQSSWTVQMYSNMYGRVRGVGAAGGMHASPAPTPDPGNCTFVNISRTKFANYWWISPPGEVVVICTVLDTALCTGVLYLRAGGS